MSHFPENTPVNESKNTQQLFLFSRHRIDQREPASLSHVHRASIEHIRHSAVLAEYHATLVPPFCLSAVKSFSTRIEYPNVELAAIPVEEEHARRLAVSMGSKRS
jgi:hypothetical protein